MRMFLKSIDKQIEELGFNEVERDEHGVSYERVNGSYTHKVALIHKSYTKPILQSYDPDKPFKYGNLTVGLTYKELKVFSKKMKQLGYV